MCHVHVYSAKAALFAIIFQCGLLLSVQIMSHLFGRNSIGLFDPPNEEQWKSIHHRMNEKNWLIQSHWNYFGVNAKLSYVKAVISTDDNGWKLVSFCSEQFLLRCIKSESVAFQVK